MVVDKTQESPIYDIVATDGDTCLGGEEFDALLAEACLDRLEHKGIHVRDDRKVVAKIKRECENAKIQLSSA